MRSRSLPLLASLVVALLALGTTVAGAVQDQPTFVRSMGTSGSGDGQLLGPIDADVDATGNSYVANYLNDRIEVYGPTGGFVRTIGGPGTGDGQLAKPTGLVVFDDPSVGRQRLLVADFDNDRLQVFELTGAFVSKLTTVAGATPETLSFPGAVDVAADGRIAVADRNNDRVLVLGSDLALDLEIDVASNAASVAFSPDGSLVHVFLTIARMETYSTDSGALTGSFETVPLTSSSGYHVHVDDIGYLYFTDFVVDEVAKVSPTGELQWLLDTEGSGPGAFQGPYAARPTSDGRLLVVDAGNARIQELDLCPTDFDDVGDTHPFFFEICWMATTNVSTGYADGTFRPANAVTRQAMAAFLYRFAEEPAFPDPLTASFSDVPTDAAFFTEVEWMAAEGISNGYGDGTFRPGAAVSRQAMAAFMYRAAGEPTFTPPVTATFSDVPTTHQFFAAVEWMAAEGISTGYGDGTFRPTAPVSRQAMSAFLARLGLLV